MTIPEHEIFVRYIDHLGCDEAVTINDDGTYSVFINPALSVEGQQKAYKHALEHINELHFEKSNVQEIEMQTHHIQPIRKEPEINVEKIAQTRKRRQKRSSTAKQWKEVNERVEFFKKYNPDYFFQQAEYNKLYGGL